MKKRVLAVMLAGGMVLGAQTGVWAASDTSNQNDLDQAFPHLTA